MNKWEKKLGNYFLDSLTKNRLYRGELNLEKKFRFQRFLFEKKIISRRLEGDFENMKLEGGTLYVTLFIE